MLTFVVPIKSERVSGDWLEFCKLVERTFKSICNQTDQNFKLVAVCHEIPQIDFSHKNIHYLKVDFEPPIKKDGESDDSINKRRELDKGKKLKLGAKYSKEKFDTDYVMTVDSDDYVSNRIVAYVNSEKKDIPGWYTKNGYLHFEGKSFLFATFKFSYLCGSSIIVKPDLLKYFFEVDPVLYFDHRLTVLDNRTELNPLPFYGGIYSIANGENHLMHVRNIKKFNNHKGWLSSNGLKRIVTKLKNYRFRFITNSIRKEFSFYS
ncbi:MAG: hypothetical protein ACX93I_10350 [Winogradskyella sp.]|jgi:hypothetical protein